MNSDWSKDSGMIETILDEDKYIKNNGLEADIQKWSKMSSWTLLQAICIFHGLDPVRGLQNKYLKPYPIYKSIMDAYDIMKSFVSDNKIPHEGDPMLFFDWAELAGITVSKEVRDAVLEEGNKRDMFELERNGRQQSLVDGLEREIKIKQTPDKPLTTERVPQNFLAQFTFTPKSTVYGYLPALEEVLEEARQAGEPIPSPIDAYERMRAKNPKLVIFATENKTLTYTSFQGEESRTVTLKAIGQAISLRTEYIKASV
ncbi:MAG: hypothetical protein O3A09_03000 [Bacteroidetes bacterium]|nr:hypothetical protein [Bacteroidota bacterium]